MPQVVSVTNVKNTQYATQLLAQTTLRNILGTKSLQELLSDREAITHNMQTQLDEGTGPWGVKVERVEMYVVSICIESFFLFVFQYGCSFTSFNATINGSRS
jgi:erythrocyte band 7 integral membrane protein